ncbi:hypothetical protein Bca4012_049354 [Brassica carinata]|uniref:RING-type domain-containing protein n=2 Tax=Brassica TaxID=3705 RepID=A0A8X7R3F6_BRACI|nr:hypothetical protein Bca52824_052132 [Brassica carinata]VDD21976.1 unnamed protein product [Brassica oleracea]
MDLDGIISTKQTVNYESKTRAIHSNTPVSFSIRVREVELRFVRDGSVLRENLLKHRTIASPVIGLEIPPCFLAGEEICRGYVAKALSKTIIPTWIQPFILPQICKDAITEEGKRSGFMVEAQVGAVKQTYINNCIDVNDYNSGGLKIPTEPDCPICLQDFGPRSIITKLRCCDYNFHRDCILTWLGRKPSCPTCRDDIHNPRPKKFTPKIFLGR